MSALLPLAGRVPGNFGTPLAHSGPGEPDEFFREHGFTCFRGVLARETAIAAEPAVRRIQDETWSGAESTAQRQAQRSLMWPMHEAPAELAQIFASPSLKDLIFQAHGSRDVRYLGWVIFHRPGGEEGTFWHTDIGHMPFSGDIIQYWMPLTALPNGQGLMFHRDMGSGPTIHSFSDMQPGDVSIHRHTVWHAGQTYPEATTGISFITFRPGPSLEDSPNPVYHQARLAAIDALFPGLSFGDAAESDLTPAVQEFAATYSGNE